MRFLLDTHALLWWLFDDRRLSERAAGIISDPENELFVSAASVWEIGTKHRLGKLPAVGELLRDVSGWLQRARFRELPIQVAHAQRAASWPQPHRDPFDRMLAAQSALEDLPILTRDEQLATFGVRCVW